MTRWLCSLALASCLLGAEAWAAPAIPADVARCIAEQKMWVAAPEYFESLEVETSDGRRAAAYQILDRAAGRVGRLLVMPAACRIVVLVEEPLPEGRVRHRLSVPAGVLPTMSELRSLLAWAGYREIQPGAEVPPGGSGRRFARDGRYLWMAGGVELVAFDLQTGHQRAIEVQGATLVGAGLYLEPERRVIGWEGLRAWLRWDSSPNELEPR